MTLFEELKRRSVFRVALVACAGERQDVPDVISDAFPNAQEEIFEAVQSIKSDIESNDIEGFQAMHLESEKFTKSGPSSLS